MEGLEIYSRQKDLNLNPPRSVAIIGVGGVGSWMALNLALVGSKKIVLVDHDEIEIHNLNRTPFKLQHVGCAKVIALSELIHERRNDVEVIALEKKIEEVDEVERIFFDDVECVVDCRDIKKPLPDFLAGRKVIALGYDGFRVTLHFNPNYDNLWGQPVRYTVVPSFLVPPQLLANIVTLMLCTNTIPSSEKIIRFDVRDLVRKVVG